MVHRPLSGPREPYDLVRGAVLPFEKSGSRVFFDDIPIWLTRSDWTAMAEIIVGPVVVLVVQTDKVDAPVKWEPATGGLYPHIYGPLNMNAVTSVVSVEPNADGVFDTTAADLRRPRSRRRA